jgi:hypothetical protein
VEIISILAILGPEEPTIVENFLKIIIGAFAIMLLAITVSAYRKTHFKKIIYAVAAFALFAFFALFDFLVDNVNFFNTLHNDVDILLLVILLAILALFFLAVVRRK